MSKTQYRIDHSSLRRHYVCEEGYLYADAVFARDGILEYTNADGTKRRELRLPEENKKALTGFGRKPFTIEHPPILVNAKNVKDLGVGMTDPEVVYDKSGFVKGVITVMDSDAVDLIVSGQKPEVSVGYQCQLEHKAGVWKGERYDAIQRNVIVNHVCATAKGRAGRDVRINLDSDSDTDFEIAYAVDSLDPSLDNPPKGGNMASLTIGKATYENVPAEVVAAMSSELQRLDTALSEIKDLKTENSQYKQEISDANARVDSATAELSDAIERADTQEGKAERLEEILDDSIPLLQDSGFNWDSETGQFIPRNDMDMDDEEDDEEAMPLSYKKGKKKDGGFKKVDMKKTDMKKYDSEDEVFNEELRIDSVEEIVEAIFEAEELCPGIRQDSDLAGLTVREIQEQVIARLDSDRSFIADASDGYVAGVYFQLTTQARADAANGAEEEELDAPRYAQDAFRATTEAPNEVRDDSVAAFAGESGARMANAWQQPL